MNVTLVTALSIIFICIVLYFIFRNSGKLQDNGRTTNSTRDNNNESREINRATEDIVRKLERENREAGELNGSIREDNRKARDIIEEVRKQKLDR